MVNILNSSKHSYKINKAPEKLLKKRKRKHKSNKQTKKKEMNKKTKKQKQNKKQQ